MVDIQKAKEHDLFLRTQIGEGKIGDESFVFTIAANGSFFLVEFDDAKYIINTQSLIEDVIEFRKKEKENNGS